MKERDNGVGVSDVEKSGSKNAQPFQLAVGQLNPRIVETACLGDSLAARESHRADVSHWLLR